MSIYHIVIWIRLSININSLSMWWWHCAQQDATNIQKSIFNIQYYWLILIACLVFFRGVCVCAHFSSSSNVIDFKLRYSYNNQEIGSIFYGLVVLYSTFLLLPDPKNSIKHFWIHHNNNVHILPRYVRYLSVSLSLSRSLPLCVCAYDFSLSLSRSSFSLLCVAKLVCGWNKVFFLFVHFV